jgi:hypothetical protein
MGMRRETGPMDLPASKADEKEHVVRYEPTQCRNLSRGRVRRGQHVQMRLDKFPPCSRPLALGSGWEPWRLRLFPVHRLFPAAFTVRIASEYR